MTVTASARRKARHYAMQALYQWHMAGASLNTIEAEFHADNDMSKADVPYFRDLLHGVAKNLDRVEGAFAPHLDRSVDELDPVSRALLRMSTYELLHRVDVPYKVVINEAIALAKKFGPTDAYKFINGILDKTAADLRAAEVAADKNA
ncbi:transcription antitermination factor NusB [Microbulbifer thermotolerans]|uniref:transcription antitermination factor NusB n=1 Tax=Microbulbifer thermotolerans TaxID=252514 RepID=UPI00224B0998|nr:transcription antitermination factor NusB [Microbulbifer thermotolerans]MCX2780830.1 transcription antitermination factor NusB [Microbulbifer thermotolerans]MCX2804795.1 transcription antitermination factor NusB [Microbulbifer thermotolerans]